MIVLSLEGVPFEEDIRQLCMAFFPGQRYVHEVSSKTLCESDLEGISCDDKATCDSVTSQIVPDGKGDRCQESCDMRSGATDDASGSHTKTNTISANDDEILLTIIATAASDKYCVEVRHHLLDDTEEVKSVENAEDIKDTDIYIIQSDIPSIDGMKYSTISFTSPICTTRKESKDELKRRLYTALSSITGRKLPWGSLTGIRPTKLSLAMLEEGMPYSTAVDRLMRDYLVSEAKATLCTDVAMTELEAISRFDYRSGYSLYVHIPFCPTTCAYCSFTSYPVHVWQTRIDEYLDFLCRELTVVAEMMRGLPLYTIYIGGGTPTTLSSSQLDRLLGHIRDSFDTRHLLELTVESGRPDSITAEKLQVLHDHGVNRISINPQSLNQKTLDAIGRRHTIEQFLDSYYLARDVGFDTINTDIIVGLPGESLSDLAHTLDVIRQISPDDVTVHALAIKRAARLRKEYEGIASCQCDATKQGAKETVDKSTNTSMGVSAIEYHASQKVWDKDTKEATKEVATKTTKETVDKSKNTSMGVPEIEYHASQEAWDKDTKEAAERFAKPSMGATGHGSAQGMIEDMVDLTYSYMKDMGLIPYYLYRQKNIAGNFENVGYCKAGHEGLYNILIMEELESIVACGAGAVSRLCYYDENRIERIENVKDPKIYMERFEEMIARKNVLKEWRAN